MQLTKVSKLKIFHTPGTNLSVEDMLSRSFTKTELKLNQLKHKQLSSQIDFAKLQKKIVNTCSLHNTTRRNMILTLFLLIMEQINSLSV